MSQAKPLPENPVDAALEAVRRLDEALRGSGCDGAPAVAGRAKEAPQLILQAGLVPTITFYLSKLNRDEKRRAYIDAVKAVTGMGGAGGDICREVAGEGGGYPHIAALLLAYAAQLAGCCPGSIAAVGAPLADCLKRIRSEGGVALERMVLAYAQEVKKLATALYEEKG